MLKTKIKINELLFSIYIFLFILTRIILITYSEYSKIILFVITSCILLISVTYNWWKNKKIVFDKIYAIILIVTSILYILSKVFNNNKWIDTYIYEFLIYGVITMYLYTQIKCKRTALKYIIIISTILKCMYALEPFIGYKYTTGYMQFGFMCILPAFCAIYIGRKIFEWKFLLIFEIISFLELLFFANRGSILTALFFIILIDIIYERFSWKIIAKYVGVAIFVTVVSFNMGYISENIFEKYNIKSYSFAQTYDTIVGVDNGLAGRDEIWKEAVEYFLQSPIIGYGIASFNNYYGRHPHSIVLEFLTSFGIVGTIIFASFCIIAVINILKAKNSYEKVFNIYFMTLGLVPLVFNMYFSKWQYFWVFIIIASNILKNKIGEQIKNGKYKKKLYI